MTYEFKNKVEYDIFLSKKLIEKLDAFLSRSLNNCEEIVIINGNKRIKRKDLFQFFEVKDLMILV